MCFNTDFYIEGTQLWMQVQHFNLVLLTLVQESGWENTGMLYFFCINACFELLREMWCGRADSACAPWGALCEIPVGALGVLSIPAAPAVLGNGSPGAVFNRSCFLWLSACLHVILHYLFIDTIDILLVTVVILLLPVRGLSLQLNSLWIISYFWHYIRLFVEVLETWKWKSSGSCCLIQKSPSPGFPNFRFSCLYFGTGDCTCEWLLFQAA